ncbi:MAG: hypothetical protein ACJAUV_000826 [Flavobacteriales bacterium]|jgi:hypothetical protein
MLKFLSTKNLFVVFYLCSFWSISHAQINEYYFHDTEGKEGNTIKSHIKVGDYLIVCGKNFERQGYQPVVTKLDTLGNIVWTTSDPKRLIDNTDFVHQIMYAEDNIYALTSEYEIWQINEQTGIINWKITLPGKGGKEGKIFDVDSVTIGAYYEYVSEQGSGNSGQHYDLMNKGTGNVMQSQFIEGSYNGENYKADSKYNVYKLKGRTLSKCYMFNIDSVFWETLINIDLDAISQLYVDDNNDIFLFGHGESNSTWVAKINNLNGEVLWNAVTSNIRPYHNYIYSNHIDKNGHIYVTWKQNSYGSTKYDFNTVKISKNSGSVMWQSITDFEEGDDSGLSIDIDDQGDVFVTGTVDDPHEAARFGIVKINGGNGNLHYKKIITIDSVNAKEAYGRGIGVSVINNKPYFIGHVQTDISHQNLRSKPAFVGLNSNNGAIDILKTDDGHYQFESKTIDIQHVGKDKFAVLKQVGRFMQVEMYDEDKELLWVKSLLREQYLEADKMVVDSSGNVIVSGFPSFHTSSTAPFYYMNYKRMYLFKINPEGEIEREHEMYERSTLLNENSYLICNKFGSYFIYNSGSRIKKINDPEGSADKIILEDKQLSPLRSFLYLDNKFVIGYSPGYPLEGDQSFALYNLETDELEPLSDVINDSLPEVLNFEVLSNNKILFYGRPGGKYKVMLFDVTNARFLWSTEIYISFLDKIAFYNNKDEVIYLLDRKLRSFKTIAINANNGAILWSFNQNNFTDNYIIPQDLCIDVHRQQITVTGYERDKPWVSKQKIAWQNLFINTLDMEGNLINQYIEKNDSASAGYCVRMLPDNSVWLGGKLAKNDSVRSGFIFEMDSSLFVPEDPELTDDPEVKEEPNNVEIIATYPVPFIGELNIKVKVKQDNSNIETSIYNLEGVLLYTFNKQAAVAGDYYIKLDASELTGINILIVRTNDEVYRHQILGLNKLEE